MGVIGGISQTRKTTDKVDKSSYTGAACSIWGHVGPGPSANSDTSSSSRHSLLPLRHSSTLLSLLQPCLSFRYSCVPQTLSYIDSQCPSDTELYRLSVPQTLSNIDRHVPLQILRCLLQSSSSCRHSCASQIHSALAVLCSDVGGLS